MAEYEKKVRAKLKEYGFEFLRHGKGDHDIWSNKEKGINVTVDGRIKSRFTANAIMKEAGIPYRF